MEEQWKQIDGYENYSISTKGRVRNTKTKRLLDGCVNSCGYVKITLYKDKKAKAYQLHRLVARAFVENPDHKELVRHTDGDNLNNDASNLYWVSFLEFLVIQARGNK